MIRKVTPVLCSCLGLVLVASPVIAGDASRGAPPAVTNVTQTTMHATIQDALNNASTGDVIEIGAGTIFEDGISFPNNVDVTVRGVGKHLTFIDGSMGMTDIGTFEISGTGQTRATVIEHLTIQNGDRANGAFIGIGGALYVGDVGMTFRSVDFTGNTTPGSGASDVNARGTADVLFEDCGFYSASSGSGGVLMGGDAQVTMINCVIKHSELTLSVLQTSSCLVINSTSVGSVRGRDSAVCNFANTIITGAQLSLNASVLTFDRCLFAGATGNNVGGLPTFVDAMADDYRLAAGSLGIDAADSDTYINAGGGLLEFGGGARSSNDAATADTGSGAYSFLDIGAHEFQGTSGAPCAGDINGDGLVDAADLGILIGAFGTNCP